MAPLHEADTRLKVTKLEPDQSARTPGLPMTIEVTYDVELVTPLFSSVLPNPVTLRSKSVMRVE